jgi:transposase, IS5 family
MYRKRDKTPEFSRFEMSFGGTLRADNRWVILEELIPWDEVETRYASCFREGNGRPAFPVRVALGALIIKERLKASDEETVEQIQENHYLQYFLGYESYRDERPFDPSMMVHFRKRLSGDVIKEINELVIAREMSKSQDKQDGDDAPPDSGNGKPGNRGTMIVDATVAPEDMRFPHDVTTLDEARRKTEKIIDRMFEHMPEGSEKPRTYRRIARKKFLLFIRNRKPGKRAIRKALKTQIQYVERNLGHIETMAGKVGLGTLSRKEHRDLLVITEYVRQQRELLAKGDRSMPGKILSICKPHVRAIARGKARGMYEFGAKVTVSLVEGLARVERLSWDNYNESTDLKAQIEEYRSRYGAYPEVVCADKIFRTRDTLEFCTANHIRLSGPKLGRPYLNETKRREQRSIERADEATRVAIEGKFGEGKRSYGLDCITMRLKETSETAILMAFFMMNLMKLARDRARSLLDFFVQAIRQFISLFRLGLYNLEAIIVL